MSAIERNIAARDAFTGVLGRSSLPTPTTGEFAGIGRPLTAAEAEKALFGHHYKQPGMPTYEDCKAHLQQIRDKFDDLEGVTALLQRFGCTSIKDLWIGTYVDFCDYAKDCIKNGRSPVFAQHEESEEL